MVAELIGPATVFASGGMMTASSVFLARSQRRVLVGELGNALRKGTADTVAAPIPADMAALLERMP